MAVEGAAAEVELNRALWDARTPIHVASVFYDVEGWKGGRSSLDRLERAAVGDVEGQSLLHLQCHFGLDTLSWARLGATVTGLDFSAQAIAAARRLADEVGLDATFVEADVLEADLGRRFDVVFTSSGVLNWLPDLDRWAATVARHLVPGGRLALVEGHPVLWPWDERPQAGPTLTPRYPYFQGPEALRLVAEGTYAEPGAPLELPSSEWNHDLGQVVTAAVGAGLLIERLEEHAVCVWQALPWMERDDDGLWRLPGDPLPLSYTLVARSPA